jgi:hypothetical protein
VNRGAADARAPGGPAGSSSQAGGRSQAGSSSQAVGRWQECLPELGAAAFLVLSTTLAVYAYAGLGTTMLVAGGWALAVLVSLLAVVPVAGKPLAQPDQRSVRGHASFLGFWRKRSMLTDATASMASYDADLRPTLQHLLAARLAERHGVSLHADPAAARRLLLPADRDQALWFWLDPLRPAENDKQKRGIPARTLAAIFDRLERL